MGMHQVDLGKVPKCNMCDKTAVVRDTEYDEYYCRQHAEDYCVYDGPYELIVEGS